MLRVGLTGGIACGKTTAIALFRELDCPVLEADPLVHELLEPGQDVYQEIVEEFGEGILDEARRIIRLKLGGIVFADPARLRKLNQIVHPRVLGIVQQWFASLDRPDGPEFAIHEAALMVESGFYKELDRVIVVWCTRAQQLERLLARGLTLNQAQQRIAAQMPIDEKRKFADDLIDCSRTIEETESQVVALVSKLKSLAASARKA